MTQGDEVEEGGVITDSAPPSPISNLVPAGTRFEVEVRSKANPEGDALRLGRLLVKKDSKVRDLFQKTLKEKTPPSEVAPKLEELLLVYAPKEELEGVAEYLADELAQLGGATLMVSTTTGRAIAKITEKDVFLPPMVLRENGNLVQPPPRLNPQLEATLVQWCYDRAAEDEEVIAVMKKFPGTELLKLNGNTQVQYATIKGRKELAKLIQDFLPEIYRDTGGATKAFYESLPLIEAHAGRNLLDLDIRLQKPILGPSRSVRSDAVTSVCSLIPVKTALIISHWILVNTYQKGICKKVGSLKDIMGEGPEGGVWITTPELGAKLLKLAPAANVLVVEFSHPSVVHLPKRVGLFGLRRESVVTREANRTWSIGVTGKILLDIDLKKASCYLVGAEEHESEVV